MTRERDFRKKVIEILQPIGAFAVECSSHDGVPDVCCVAGWIELKIATRPKRDQTRVDVDLRNSQRIWLKNWRLHGGRAWTLTKLEELWLLHDGLWASQHLGTVSELELRRNAVGQWPKAPSFEELARCLTKITQVN